MQQLNKPTPISGEYYAWAGELVAAEVLDYYATDYDDATNARHKMTIKAAGEVARDAAVGRGDATDVPVDQRTRDHRMYWFIDQAHRAIGGDGAPHEPDVLVGLAYSEARAITADTAVAIATAARRLAADERVAELSAEQLRELTRDALAVVPRPFPSCSDLARMAERMSVSTKGVVAAIIEAGLIVVAIDPRPLATCGVCGMQLGPEHFPRWPDESQDDWIVRRHAETNRRWDIVHQAGAIAARRILGEAYPTVTWQPPLREATSPEAMALVRGAWPVIVRVEQSLPDAGMLSGDNVRRHVDHWLAHAEAS
jgi:hypothetical protein